MFRPAFCTAFLAAASAAGAAGSIFISPYAWSGFIHVDLDTGRRTLHELYDYPRIIEVESLYPESPTVVVIEGGDASGRRALWRYDLATQIKSPVTGFVDSDSTFPLGGGEALGPDLDFLCPAPGGAHLFFTSAPMRMVRAEADASRTLISRSAEPALGIGPAIERPADIALERDAKSALVLERFQGIYRVILATGDRSVAHPNEQFSIIPDEFELLLDGRIATLRRDPDVDALFVLDPKTAASSLLSGDFGGSTRGEGPTFGTLYSLASDNFGRLYVYDAELLAVLQVDPRTGNRAIISGGPDDVGGGEPIPTADDRPLLRAAFAKAPGAEGWLVQ